MVSEKLNTAIAVIQSGDKATGARLLKEILHDDPSNEKAWMWLSACVDKNDQKVYCLNMALSINPTNSLVAKALSHLELPRQPAAEETVPEYMKELSSSLETQAPYEDKSEIIEPLGKPVINPNVTSHHAKVPLKSTNKIKEKYIVILGISLVLVLCVILFIVFLIKESDFIGNMNILDTSTAFTEADAVRVVQNWKAPSNMGITCQEVFDEIVYVYNNNLDISEAEVKWSAVKQSEFVFIVHANLRGETGWANYRWQVKFPDEEIISLGDMHICASLDNTTNHIFINTPIFQNNLDITTSTPIPRENFGLATNTPANTQEPISASEPIVITGSGNSIVSIDKWDGPALIHITGSPSANSFFFGEE